MKPVNDVFGVSVEVATYLGVEPFIGALTEVQRDELGGRVHEVLVKEADSLVSFPDLAKWDDMLLDSVAKAMRQVVFKGGDVGRITRAQESLGRIPCLRRAFQKRQSARRRREQKENELQKQKRLRQESEKRAAKLEHDLAKTEQREPKTEELTVELDWMALQQKEMMERADRKTQALLQEVAGLATKVGALTKENKIVQRRLQKEMKSKQACRDLLDHQTSTDRPKRACTQQQPEPEPVRITAADARGHYEWVHDKVREEESQIAGMGLFSKVDIAANQIVFDALLPDEDCSAAFADTEYSCYKHILHKDGASALAIDPGSNMGGNVWACQNDNKVRFLRLLNHSKSPNVFLDIKEAATPLWYEHVGGVKYGPWYTCSIRTIREVRVGDEILIKYAEHPLEWDV